MKRLLVDNHKWLRWYILMRINKGKCTRSFRILKSQPGIWSKSRILEILWWRKARPNLSKVFHSYHKYTSLYSSNQLIQTLIMDGPYLPARPTRLLFDRWTCLSRARENGWKRQLSLATEAQPIVSIQMEVARPSLLFQLNRTLFVSQIQG